MNFPTGPRSSLSRGTSVALGVQTVVVTDLDAVVDALDFCPPECRSKGCELALCGGDIAVRHSRREGRKGAGEGLGRSSVVGGIGILMGRWKGHIKRADAKMMCMEGNE